MFGSDCTLGKECPIGSVPQDDSYEGVVKTMKNTLDFKKKRKNFFFFLESGRASMLWCWGTTYLVLLGAYVK